MQAIVSSAFAVSGGAFAATDSETLVEFQNTPDAFYAELCQNSYKSKATLLSEGFEYTYSPFQITAVDTTKVLYEYAATSLEHLQVYYPVVSDTNNGHPIIFAVTGTNDAFGVFRALGLLVDYVGYEGSFFGYNTEYDSIKTEVYSILTSIAGDTNLQNKPIVFTGHSVGGTIAYNLYADVYDDKPELSHLIHVRAFCPFVYHSELTDRMIHIADNGASARASIETFAVKDDYSSALLKTSDNAFGIINWYDGDGSLAYADVDAFSSVARTAYLAHANHELDNFGTSFPLPVYSSLPTVDYGQSKTFDTLKEDVVEGSGMGVVNIALLMFSDDTDTAGIKFDMPNTATTDSQFGFTINYESTYRNKYFYYDYDDGGGSKKYVSLLTELASHSNVLYKPSVYFQRYTETVGGSQNWLIYDYDGANKNFIKLKVGSFTNLLLPASRVEGSVYNYQYTERQPTAIGYTDVFGTTGIAQGQAGYKAPASGDSLERFLFHVVPAIDSAHTQRRTNATYTEPYTMYNVIPKDGTLRNVTIAYESAIYTGATKPHYVSMMNHTATAYVLELTTYQAADWSTVTWTYSGVTYPNSALQIPDDQVYEMRAQHDAGATEPYIVKIENSITGNSAIGTTGNDLGVTTHTSALTPTTSYAYFHVVSAHSFSTGGLFYAKLKSVNMTGTSNFFKVNISNTGSSSIGAYGYISYDTEANASEFKITVISAS